MRRTAVMLLLLGLSGCGDNPTAPPPAPSPTPPAVTPTPTPAPPPTPVPNQPPSVIVKVRPDPPEGRAPLTVNWNLCTSVDPDGDELVFYFYFGDGEVHQGYCRQGHRYRRGRYTAKMCVWDARPEHSLTCKEYRVHAR